jgi:hypothetical protein
MEELLTPEEKQYLRRVANYLGSMGMEDGNIEIDMDNGWEFNYDVVDWNYVTHFANNYNADIPSGLIPILQKIMKYCDDNDIILEHDEEVNYQRLEFDIDVESKVIMFSHWWSFYSRGDSSSVDYDSEEDIERFEHWEENEFSDIEIPNNGILTVTFNGSGDSGYLEGSFEENGSQVPAGIEDWCYRELSRNFSGWEINEGSDGNFIFDFNNKMVTLICTQNFEDNARDTYFEQSFAN